MNKRKLLIENFIIYGLGTVLCNIIPFIMIPILVRIMPNSSYYMGINDLVNSLISLVSVFGLMGLYDALFRLFFDYNKDDFTYQRQICSTSLILVILFSCICALVLFLLRFDFSILFFDTEELSCLVYICALSVVLTNVKTIVMTPTRMLNQRKIYVIGTTILPLISYLTTAMLVLNGFYLFALPIGSLISMILGIIYFGIANRKWFSWKLFNKDMVIPLLKIGVPLFPTFLVFWVYSSCDRIMIVKMIGANANGMYAVANKLAAISQLVTSAFTSGWSYFNFATMKDKERVKDFSKIIEYLFVIGVFIFGIGRISGNIVMEILFTEEYKGTGATFAYLFVAPIICMLFQLMGSQFLLLKKTILCTMIAGIGVIFNIILNFVWINQYGILGAGIATVVSYGLIVVLAGFVLYNKHMLLVSKKEVIVILLFCTIVCFELKDFNSHLFMFIVLSVVFLIGIIYNEDLKKEISRTMRRKKNE